MSNYGQEEFQPGIIELDEEQLNEVAGGQEQHYGRRAVYEVERENGKNQFSAFFRATERGHTVGALANDNGAYSKADIKDYYRSQRQAGK